MINDFRAALADRYRLEEPLGEGGMATVYRAHDLKHDRPVAVKVLRADLAQALGGERFLQEIRTTARLQHPHILPLLDSGAAAGRLYYVMPLVSGETLRARLTRDGALPIAEAVRLTGQIAAALEAAHRQGVIHRDIKPENILLTDGLPLVADFGIALAVQHAGDDRLTGTGISLGTPAYMSPEQVVGIVTIDARTDLYSLGCLVFEMIAGRPPYLGATSFATMAAHVGDAIPTVTSPREPVPAALADAVRRALAKDPADRFATVAEFAATLSAATSGPQRSLAAEAPSIVVLPFENLSPDPDNAFFTDGLTEEIITDLSKVKALRVISRPSSMRLKGTDKSVPVITRELGVRYALGGSVRRAGNALRVTAQLIDGAGDAQLWAERYSGTLEDVFEIQEKLAHEIVAALRLTLAPEEERRVKGQAIKNPAAYDCYLRARQLVHSIDPTAFESARELLSRANHLVGEHPLILAAMANRLVWLVQSALAPAQPTYDEALKLARRALDIDPDCVEAHVVIGSVHKSRGEVELAIKVLRRALEIEPNQADALAFLVWVLAEAGVADEARTLALRLEAVSPFEPLAFFAASIVPLFEGRPEETRRRLVASSQWEPGPYQVVLGTLVETAFANPTELAAWADALEQQVSDLPLIGQLAAIIRSYLVGEDILATVSAEDRIAWADDTEACCMLANLLAARGERAQAVEWLRRSVELGMLNHPFLTRHNPRLAALAGYPPYDTLMAEVEPRWRALNQRPTSA